jgi:glycosyltransferase involved in cell wall biosynthesis
MTTSTIRGLASIIVPCWNQLEFTRQCVAALKKHTRPPWELIVIDNGSTDHTDRYLAGVQDAAAVPVTVITNPVNRGFPAAINQGLKAARGEYLVLLNNDAVVTDGWLKQLIALANAERRRTVEDAAGRPAVNSGAGSGDPRTARDPGSAREPRTACAQRTARDPRGARIPRGLCRALRLRSGS